MGIKDQQKVSSESYFKSATGQDSSTWKVKVAPVRVFTKICIFINDYYLIPLLITQLK